MVDNNKSNNLFIHYIPIPVVFIIFEQVNYLECTYTGTQNTFKD